MTTLRKTVLAVILTASLGLSTKAQTIEYRTFIYTSDELSELIQQESATRGWSYGQSLVDAGKGALQGIGSGYVTSFIDLGVNAIGSLITRNERLKNEWEETISNENTFSTRLGTVEECNDFYKTRDSINALSPVGMRFDGIGCLKMRNKDTVFYISCHIDRNKIDRIINHSKFELVLDTLIISPANSNLPNTYLNIPWSWEERDNFNMSMNIKLYSSWMTESIEIFNDVQLGEFQINIPVAKEQLDDKGVFKYVREKDSVSQYKIVGESFIVPRSFMPKVENGIAKPNYGTGQYKMQIELTETCDATPLLRKNWKKDRKRRKQMQGKESVWSKGWQLVSSQQWDELSQSWIITTLQAPANIITGDVIKKLGLEQEQGF